MKWLLSVTAMVVLATGAYGAALVDPQLQSILQTMDDNEQVVIDIVLNKQFDNQRLTAMVEDLPKPSRRARVGRILSDFAEREQADLLAYLRNQEAAGEVTGIMPLWIINAVACAASRGTIQQLIERSDVGVVCYGKVPVDGMDLDLAKVAPGDITDGIEPNMDLIRVRQARDQGYTGEGVVLGVVDTGVRYTHMDLRDHLWQAIDTTRASGFPNPGFNFASNQISFGHTGPSTYDSLTPLDYYGHGTHCAGLATADGAYGNGTRDTMGVAPDAKLMCLPIDVYLHSPYPDTNLDNSTWAALQFCLRPYRLGHPLGPDTLNGADLITFSIGLITSWMPRYDMWRVVEENILAAGIPHIVAAGNEASSGIRTSGNCPPPWPNPVNGTPHSTRGQTAVITIGATDNSDNIASFSSRGPSTIWPGVAPWNDFPGPTYLMDPDVSAPGVSVWSTYYSNDQSYTTMSGTSMATPTAAGCVSLMLSKNPMLTPRKIDSILELHSVVDLGTAGKDNTFGAGRINCSLAVANTPLPNDVGVMRINAPVTGNYDSLATATPSAWVKNYLVDPVSFKVRMRIGTWYQDSAQVTALAGGDSVQLTFGQWTALERGVLAVKCSTELAFDGNPANDKVEYPLTVIVHDAGAGTITVPSGTIDSASTVTPTCIVHNLGTATENITARLRIGSYDQIATATGVLAGDSVALAFPDWTVDLRGNQAPTCSTMLATDVYPSNDANSGAFFGRVHDVGAMEIVAPHGRVNPNAAVTPLVRVRNTGTDQISCDVRLEISTGYAFTQTVSNIPAETDTIVAFATWIATPPGTWQTNGRATASGDMIPGNNSKIDSVTVGDPVPPGWSEVTASIPVAPSGRAVKDGGWLVFDAASGTFYAAKGYKTGDFYQFDPDAYAWVEKPAIPSGNEAKPPYKGAVGCADGLGNIYATKGNNTTGFWKYSTVDSTWTQLSDVPLGVTNKKVKGGTDLVYVNEGDSQYVYLLKGYKTEFYRYNTASGAWYALADAPAGAKPKWDKGSWIVYDEASRKLYAHKAKYSELYAYSLDSTAWGGLIPGMPLMHSGTGKNKKAKDGSDGVILDGQVYALKGGNTPDYYSLDLETMTWTERELMPMFGSTGKKKKVKAGGSVATDGLAVYALKGNKTNEFWVYTLGTKSAGSAAPRRSGVQAERQDLRNFGLAVRPNPLKVGLATVSFTLPAPGPALVRVFDVTGRQLATASAVSGRSGAIGLDLRQLSAGVYLVRLEAAGYSAATKLVVER
jgi:hypothetical protein